jgi:hypothetical protein
MITAWVTIAFIALVGAAPGPPRDAGTKRSDSASYTMDWCVLDSSGGGSAASAGYKAEVTVGQTAPGATAGASSEIGLGYWFGVDWVLFVDDFESGDTSAWDSATPAAGKVLHETAEEGGFEQVQ